MASIVRSIKCLLQIMPNEGGLVYYYLRLTTSTLGFPCVKQDYLNKRVAQEELPVCRQFTRKTNKQTQLIFMVVYFIFAISNFLYVSYTLTNIDYVNVDKNLRSIEGEKLNKFACLTTNCSKSVPSLSDELIKLPIFSICNQHIKWIHNPVMNSHLLGLIALSTTIYWVLVMGFVGPAYQMYSETSAPVVMDILCPTSSANSTRRQIYKLWLQLAQSFLKYLTCSKAQRVDCFRLNSFGLAMNRQRQLNSMKTNSQRESLVHLAQCRLNKLEQSLQSMDKFKTKRNKKRQSSDEPANEVMGIVSDSLPINMTNWWISNLTRAYARSQEFIMFSMLVTIIVFHYLMMHFNGVDYKYTALAEMFQRNNCSLWLQEENYERSRRRYVNVEQVALSWNLFNFSSFLLIVPLPLYNFTTLLNIFYQCVNHIRILLKELEIQLKLAVELMRLGKQLTTFKTNTHHPIGSHSGESINQNGNKLLAKLIREKLINSSVFIGPVVIVGDLNRSFVKPSGAITWTYLYHHRKQNHLETKISYQQMALELLAQTNACRVDELVELLEMIQINYWYLMAFIKQFNAPLTNILLINYLVNYGLAFVSVYLYMSIKRLVVLPLIVTSMSVFVANMLIGWASTVHSSARKLEPLFWTLLAQTANESDQRLKHLRLLWTKQLDLVDGEGGLSLKAFNMSATYARIIQLTIWTSSILLYAFIRN